MNDRNIYYWNNFFSFFSEIGTGKPEFEFDDANSNDQ